uniref:Niban apoptosis regulator 2 n=1 Tax=Neogobius melanostomus TaxID=47308 RepID=A0A8C6UT73_9GOBI
MSLCKGRTRQVMRDFQNIFEQQYSVALFNSVRAEIEGAGGTHAQLLHRKDPLVGRTIFSGSLLQHVEEKRKWKNRYVSIPNSYTVDLYESKTVCESVLPPKVRINCAGYKVLNSLEEYLELINHSLPGEKDAKAGTSPFIETATLYPLILWHPYAHHHYFCVLTEKEHSKWSAVLQDCVRHANNGLPEESTVQTPTFTNSVRLYRQAQGHYGSWDMMCGTPPQILSNLVMEELQPDLRSAIGPRLKGKLQQRQRSWMLISGAVYKQVLNQATTQYEALLSGCEAQEGPLDADLRTNMDQIITSKEHVSNKIKGEVEQLLRDSVQPYVSSILEVREVFSSELVELSRNSLDQDKDKLGEHMERVSMLAFHPVKMRSCYEQVERMELEGLQQRFNVCGPSVFTGRAQILMREQMDNAVYTFEQLLNQSVEAQGEGDVCKSIQRSQDRVLKKFDYDSSTVRKKFFTEALLQIIVPYTLQQLAPSCSPELPRFQELIFEDFSRFLLVENLYEEIWPVDSPLTHTMREKQSQLLSPVKEAAVQRRHNLFRDSIVLTNSDPNLHLLDEEDTVNWSSKFSAEEPPSSAPSEPSDSCSTVHKPSIKGRVSNYSSRRRQVVSMIQLEGASLPYESCLDVPEEDPIEEEDSVSSLEEDKNVPKDRRGNEISANIAPKDVSPTSKTFPKIEEGNEISAHIENAETTPQIESFLEPKTKTCPKVETKKSPQSLLQQLMGSKRQEEEAAIKRAIHELDIAVQGEEDSDQNLSGHDSDSDLVQPRLIRVTDYSAHDDSGFQSPTNEKPGSLGPRPITNGLNGAVDPADVEVILT